MFPFLAALLAAGAIPGWFMTVMPILVSGGLSMVVYQLVKKSSNWLDTAAPPYLHVVAVFVLNFLFTQGAAMIGWSPSTASYGQLTQGDIASGLSALIAVLAHAVWKSTPPGATPPPAPSAAP